MLWERHSRKSHGYGDWVYDVLRMMYIRSHKNAVFDGISVVFCRLHSSKNFPKVIGMVSVEME